MKNDIKKAELVKALLNAVRLTREGAYIKDMRLDELEKYVIIEYESGSKAVLVECDSGIALMRDVLEHI